MLGCITMRITFLITEEKRLLFEEIIYRRTNKWVFIILYAPNVSKDSPTYLTTSIAGVDEFGAVKIALSSEDFVKSTTMTGIMTERERVSIVVRKTSKTASC